MGTLLRDAGQRYQHETLSTYQIEHEAQKPAMRHVSQFAAEITANVAEGSGLILMGPPGTGKDHLLISLAKLAISCDLRSVRFVRGSFLGQEIRDSFGTRETERDIMRKYTAPSVLILSDPVPPTGENKDFQADVLHRIVESRNMNQRAIWCSINVANEEEARLRLGSATWDRLQQNALILPCQWPSRR